MDIKDLNKPQLILLAILLSFVTSIATGIVTVTLMQQVPPSVTTPINRVVQQTVEKIQQVEGKTTTVVVKEEDLVVDAIAKNQSVFFDISKKEDGADGQMAEVSAGRGFAATSTGVIVADAVLTGSDNTYYVSNKSGKFKADFISTDSAGFSFLKIGEPVNGTDKASFTVPTQGDISKMKAGQKIIVLGVPISSFIYEGNKNINISISKSSAGALVVNLDGEVLGVALFNEVNPFAPISAINDALKNLVP